MMRFEHALTFRDYLDGQWTYLKRRRFAMISFLGFYWFLPLVGLTLFCLLVWAKSSATGALVAVSHYGVSALPLLVMAVILWPLRYLTMWRGYRAIFPGDVPRRAVFWFDEEQFGSELPGRSEAKVYWSALFDYAEDAKIALLFVGKNRFVFVPKRAMGEDEWERVRVLAGRAN